MNICARARLLSEGLAIEDLVRITSLNFFFKLETACLTCTYSSPSQLELQSWSPGVLEGELNNPYWISVVVLESRYRAGDTRSDSKSGVGD